MSTIKINVKERGRTDLALLVFDGQREAWIPHSQIQEVIVEHGLFGPEITAIVIPTWIATDKGLVNNDQDNNTLDLFGCAQ